MWEEAKLARQLEIAFHSSPFILKVALPLKHPTVAPAGSRGYFYTSFLTGASVIKAAALESFDSSVSEAPEIPV